MYVTEAEQIIAQHFPRGTIGLYHYYSTHIQYEPTEKGGVKGYVYVVFQKKDTPTIQTRDHGVILNSMTVIFETQDSYKRLVVDISGAGNSTTKEIFKQMNVRK